MGKRIWTKVEPDRYRLSDKICPQGVEVYIEYAGATAYNTLTGKETKLYEFVMVNTATGQRIRSGHYRYTGRYHLKTMGILDTVKHRAYIACTNSGWLQKIGINLSEDELEYVKYRKFRYHFFDEELQAVPAGKDA